MIKLEDYKRDTVGVLRRVAAFLGLNPALLQESDNMSPDPINRVRTPHLAASGAVALPPPPLLALTA